MSNITPLDALLALGETDVISDGIPTNADEFAVMCFRLDGVEITATWEQVVAKITELESEYTNNQYQRDRVSEYPPLAEQLDKIYHEGIDAWKADIQAIKDKYPKPE